MEAGTCKGELSEIWTSIEDIYRKYKDLRTDSGQKIGGARFENLRDKVKKMNKQLKVVNKMNLTRMEETLSSISTFTSTLSLLEENLTKVNMKIERIETNIGSIQNFETIQSQREDLNITDLSSHNAEMMKLQFQKAMKDLTKINSKIETVENQVQSVSTFNLLQQELLKKVQEEQERFEQFRLQVTPTFQTLVIKVQNAKDKLKYLEPSLKTTRMIQDEQKRAIVEIIERLVTMEELQSSNCIQESAGLIEASPTSTEESFTTSEESSGFTEEQSGSGEESSGWGSNLGLENLLESLRNGD